VEHLVLYYCLFYSKNYFTHSALESSPIVEWVDLFLYQTPRPEKVAFSVSYWEDDEVVEEHRHKPGLPWYSERSQAFLRRI
jgi:hypothetical protein